MNIRLYIEEKNFIKLCLVSGKKQIDCLEWQDQNDLSRLFLANLDMILKKNNARLDSARNSKNARFKRMKSGNISNRVDKITGYKIISRVPKKWTTYRIAKAIFKTLEVARSVSSMHKLAKK
jgi:hypothetical protein